MMSDILWEKLSSGEHLTMKDRTEIIDYIMRCEYLIEELEKRLNEEEKDTLHLWNVGRWIRNSG